MFENEAVGLLQEQDDTDDYEEPAPQGMGGLPVPATSKVRPAASVSSPLFPPSFWQVGTRLTAPIRQLQRRTNKDDTTGTQEAQNQESCYCHSSAGTQRCCE